MKRIIFALATATAFIPTIFSQKSSPIARFWNSQRGYAPFKYATEHGVEIDNDTPSPITDSCRISPSSESFTLSFRMVNHSFRTMGKPTARPYGFFLSSGKSKLWITVETEERSDMFSSCAVPKISIFRDGESSPLAVSSSLEGISSHNAGNLWRLRVRDGRLTIVAGTRNPKEIISVPIEKRQFSSFGFTVSPGGKISVTDISIEPTEPSGMKAPGKWADTAMLREYLLKSTDSMEGYWTVFDRSLDESLIRIGGDYRLAIVKNGVDYEVIYLGGATVNAASWLPGMTKAILHPDPFPGIYNLEWIDSEGNPLSHELKAQTGEGNTLSLQFPYQDSSIRLRKIPAAGQ